MIDLFERLLEDGVSLFYSFPFLIFPQLIRYGVGKKLRIVHENAKMCLQSVMEFVKNETYESKMSIVA